MLGALTTLATSASKVDTADAALNGAASSGGAVIVVGLSPSLVANAGGVTLEIFWSTRVLPSDVVLVARPEHDALEPLELNGPSEHFGYASDASLLEPAGPGQAWDAYFERIEPGCTGSPCEVRIRLEAEAGANVPSLAGEVTVRAHAFGKDGDGCEDPSTFPNDARITIELEGIER